MRSTHRRRSYAIALGAATILALTTGGAALAADPGATPTSVVLTGVPGHDDAGAVEVRSAYGESELLTPPETPGTELAGARFGAALHEQYVSVDGADTDNQLFTFVGAPGLTVDGKPNAGGIFVFARDYEQLTFKGLFTQESAGVPGNAQAGAEFGNSIDSAWVRSDPTEVFVGVPGLDVQGLDQAGGVVRLAMDRTSNQPGSGVKVSDARLHTLASSDAGVEPSAGDRLGQVVHVDWTDLDLMYGGYSFFAGAPKATVAGKPRAGFVLRAQHTDRQQDEEPDQLFYPGTKGVPGTPQAGEQFGSSFSWISESTDDWDGYPVYERIAIGAPGKTVNGHRNAGKIYRLEYITPKTREWQGISGYSQESPNDGCGKPVGGHAEAGDRFGASVQYVNEDSGVEGDPTLLLVGSPGEDVGDVADAGAVNGLHGAAGVHEGKLGGTPGANHRFGSTLSVTLQAESGDDWYDYLIGVPGANDGAGAVVHGERTWKQDDVTWQPAWTLFDGGQPGDDYGRAFGHSDSTW